MYNPLDLLTTFIAGVLINFVSNIENFYSSVKIKSWYSGLIGFICWMLTGLVFADILTSSENKLGLVLMLSLGGGIGNFCSSYFLTFFNNTKKRACYFAKKRKKYQLLSTKKLTSKI